MAGIRRIVTGNNAQGLGVIASDTVFEPQPVTGGIASFAKLWTTDQSPADNTDEFDGALRKTGLTCPGGTVLRFVDFAPGKASPMHKTNSIDYGIVLSGAIELQLDGGVRTRLKPGDVVIQRGTNHAWANMSVGWSRMVFVLIAAEPLGDGTGVTP